MNRDEIRAVFLANGFTIKEGQDDLKPYVYEAAEALLAAANKPPPQRDVEFFFSEKVTRLIEDDVAGNGRIAQAIHKAYARIKVFEHP